MGTYKVDIGEIDDLKDRNIFVEGMGGCGKTNALVVLGKELVESGSNVAFLDFRNELNDYFEEFNKKSFDSFEISEDKIEEGFNHIHFSEDICFTHNEYKLDFLSVLAKKIDYLIADEAHLLRESAYSQKSKKSKSVKELCEELIKMNPKLKFIFAVQSRDYFLEDDLNFVLNLCENRLLFRLSPSKLKKEEQYISMLSVGEAVLFSDETPLKCYSFYKKMKQEDLDFINQYLNYK